MYNYLKTKMFRVAILTRPYIPPYISTGGQDRTDILYNNYSSQGYNPADPTTWRGRPVFQFTRTYSGRPLGQ